MERLKPFTQNQHLLNTTMEELKSGWHIFREAEWVIREDLGGMRVDREDFGEGETDSQLDIMVEDYNKINEFHCLAKTLPFWRSVFLDNYKDDERIHPQKVLLLYK